MSYPEARRPLPPHTRGEYYIYIHLFTLFQSTDYYFPVFISTVWAEYPGGLEPEDHSCRTPLESNIQPQTVPQVRKCIPHWISYSEKSCSFLGSHLSLLSIWLEVMIAFYMLHFQECGGSGATRYSYSEQRRLVTSRQSTSLANCVYL